MHTCNFSFSFSVIIILALHNTSRKHKPQATAPTMDYHSLSLRPQGAELQGIHDKLLAQAPLRLMLIDVLVRDKHWTEVRRERSWFETETLDDLPIQTGDDSECHVGIFGLTAEGASVFVDISGYQPWVRVEVPDPWRQPQVDALCRKLQKALTFNKVEPLIKAAYEPLKRFYGFVPDGGDPSKAKTFGYAKLSFDSLRTMDRAVRWLKANEVSIMPGLPATKLEVYDTLQKPVTKFMNDLDLTASDWIELTSYRLQSEATGSSKRKSNCQLEVDCAFNPATIKPFANNAVAPMIIASFDGEMYSHDGTFPNVAKGDCTVYIGTNFKRFGSPKVVRVMQCLGAVTKPPPSAIEPHLDMDIVVLCYDTLAALHEGWRDLLVAMDPDCLVSWNGYGFDFPFMNEDYLSTTLEPHYRLSEGIQFVLQRKAAELYKAAGLPAFPGLDLQPVTIADAIREFASKNGQGSVKAQLQQLQRSVGSKAIKQIKKAWKEASGGGKGESSLACFDDAEEEEEEEESDLSFCAVGVSAKQAAASSDDVASLLQQHNVLEVHAEEVRGTLLSCFASSPLHARAHAPTAAKLLELMKASPRGEAALAKFWEWVRGHASLGPGIEAAYTSPVHAPLNEILRGQYLGRLAGEDSLFCEKRMASQAKGDNTYYYYDMPGRLTVDLMQIIKDDKKPDDNSLRYAAEKWLGAGKDKDGKADDKAKMDLSAAELFRLHREGAADSSLRWPIVAYCARDCDIPLMLIEKLSYVPQWIEMSRVCYTNLQAVCNSGQQVKVFNLIARFVHGEYAINVRDSGWPVNDYGDEEEEEGLQRRKPDYQGATVIEPQKGFYATPVTVLDFASLYPSIIRFFNLCPSTLVCDPRILATLKSLKARGVPILLQEHTIRHNVLVAAKGSDGQPVYKEEDRVYAFVMHVQGVLPKLLTRLLNARKAVKKQMEASEDPFEKAVLNGRQNGIKVACNSVYGFTGVAVDKGMLPCKPVAAVTTLNGRAFIEAARQYVESTYKGCKVVYGDSVTADTPFVVRDRRGFIHTVRADALFRQCAEAHPDGALPYLEDKQQVIVDSSLSVWTERGWTAIKRVIRHKTAKKLYRVATGQGLADVTEDHSLLDEDARKVRPAEVAVGSKLLHAQVLPMGSAVSTLGEVTCCTHVAHVLGFGLGMPYKDYFFPNATGEAVVPPCILNAELKVIQAFWDGFTASSCTVYGKGGAWFPIRGKEGALGLQLVCRRLGIPLEVVSSEELNLFLMRVGKGDGFSPAITSITPLPSTSDFVYDLETESHHFHVGPGNLVVHNTDSVMIFWNEDMAVEAAFARGEEAAAAITAMLREGKVAGLGGAGGSLNSVGSLEGSPARNIAAAANAVELTNEKVYMPYLLDKKKRYAGIKHTLEKGGFKSELDMKGIDAVRRDRPLFVRTICKKILDALLYKRNVEAARDVLVDSLEDIIQDRMAREAFIMSKTTRSAYKSESVPQLGAWQRMIARGDDGVPPVGARMPFLIVAPPRWADRGGSKCDVKMYERAEHPAHVAKHSLLLDKEYYIEQLLNPTSKLLEHVGVKGMDAIFAQAMIKANERLKGVKALGCFGGGTIRKATCAVEEGEGQAMASAFPGEEDFPRSKKAKFSVGGGRSAGGRSAGGRLPFAKKH